MNLHEKHQHASSIRPIKNNYVRIKNVLRISGVILLVLSIFFIHSCKKENKTLPVISTTGITEISQTTAISGGDVTEKGSDPILFRGVCWDTTEAPTISNNKTIVSSESLAFSSSITGLEAGKEYYVRAYATSSLGTAYGNTTSFATAAEIPPVLTTSAVSAITTNEATSGGNISSAGSSAVTARGVCWSRMPNPSMGMNKMTSNGTGIGPFTSSITGLEAGTTYYVRAFATTGLSTSYGNEYVFKTLAPTLPQLLTTIDGTITSTSANIGGVIYKDGGTIIFYCGVNWWGVNSSGSTYNESHTGAFSNLETRLVPDKEYSIQAWAKNSVGIGYGQILTFRTALQIPPVLTTTAVSAVTHSTAKSGGIISSEGSSPVMSRGVCWSTKTNPTIENNHTSDGSGVGTFTSSITGLERNTKYYVRAFAFTRFKTFYGNEYTFTTLIVPTPPVLSMVLVSAITTTTAKSGGDISSDGGSVVTARGVCWSKTGMPTTANSKTIDGTGKGAFTSSMVGLAPGTTYYVRAYATNSVGTGYSSGGSFRTKTQ